MNFFHAMQYFALVWWSEKEGMARLFGLRRWAWGGSAALPIFLSIAFGYGVWAKLYGESSHLSFSILLTVSIMHFWYDGFVWSVSRGQVA